MKLLHILLLASVCAFAPLAYAEKMSFDIEIAGSACQPNDGCIAEGRFEFTLDQAALDQVSPLVVVSTAEDYIRQLATTIVKESLQAHTMKELGAKNASAKLAAEIKNKYNEALQNEGGVQGKPILAVRVVRLTAQLPP
jgi:hypothetical protein